MTELELFKESAVPTDISDLPRSQINIECMDSAKAVIQINVSHSCIDTFFASNQLILSSKPMNRMSPLFVMNPISVMIRTVPTILVAILGALNPTKVTAMPKMPTRRVSTTLILEPTLTKLSKDGLRGEPYLSRPMRYKLE